MDAAGVDGSFSRLITTRGFGADFDRRTAGASSFRAAPAVLGVALAVRRRRAAGAFPDFAPEVVGVFREPAMN